MNSGDIVPETEGDVRGGIGGAVLAGVLSLLTSVAGLPELEE